MQGTNTYTVLDAAICNNIYQWYLLRKWVECETRALLGESMRQLVYSEKPHLLFCVWLRKLRDYVHYAIAVVSWMKYAGVHITISNGQVHIFISTFGELNWKHLETHSILRFFLASLLFRVSLRFSSRSPSSTSRPIIRMNEHAKRLRYIKICIAKS